MITDNNIIESESASKKHGINIENLDVSVNPKSDFYEYACGGWMKKHPIPSDYSAYGTFNLLREAAKHQLRDLINGLASTPEAKIKGSNAQKVSDLYNMALDENRRNILGASPVMPLIEKANDYSLEDLAPLLSWLHNGLSGVFFSCGVGPHPQNSNLNILHVGESGLTLGDRDYYLDKNETNDKILNAFEIYVKMIMSLIGRSDDEQDRIWKNVLTIETNLAIHKMTREETRDPKLSYNMTSVSELKNKFPQFDWSLYFESLGINSLTELNVLSVSYLDFVIPYIFSLSEQELRDYLVFSIVAQSTGVLSEDFQEADFELYGRVMSGTEERQPLWKRALAIPNSMLGEAVGELYVKKYFPEDRKKYMLELVSNLKKSLQVHIKGLSWMSNETKSKALEKLEKINVKIGYPDKWKDYSEIDIDPKKSYLENVYRASVWFTQDNLKKLNKPVDKTLWYMTPQTVNAYYSPINNEICFPAAILQAPYFDPNADDAVNYGAIGVVIGHEMTHGFDDQGRQFDKDGNLNEWWTTEDSEKFNLLADKLVEQFNNVEVAPGVMANGRFTLGENIADQGGLRIALTAYLNSHSGVEENIDGFSPLQRFYLAYANVWAQNIRPEEILSRTKTDPHSLAKNRVNVTLRNIEPFFRAFAITEGDQMFRKEDERVIIW